MRYMGSRKKERSVKSEIDCDVLSINCRECGHIPDPACAECVRCIVTEIGKHGCVERIRMRTGKDIEISGAAVELLCELSFVDTSSAVHKTRKGRCRTCGYSEDRIMRIAWETFPEPDFVGARGRLMTFRTGNSVCDVCIHRTYRALDQAELSMSEISRKASSFAER